MEENLRAKIRREPQDPMNYYFLGKELLKRPVREISSIQEIENLFRKSIELGQNLWAPKIMLGELLFKLGRFKEAEVFFRESLCKLPESVFIKEYLAKCIEINSKSNREFKKISKKDALFVFENNVREFLKILLLSNHGDNWWRKGVPKKVRAKCAARREEGLDEEKDADLLLFGDFYDYKLIIDSNKGIFANYIDNKEWGQRLNAIEPIRNAIAHNRPLTESEEKIQEFAVRFQEVFHKVVKEKE